MIGIQGLSTGGKPVNIGQLDAEMRAAQVDVGQGLGLSETTVFCYQGGTPGLDGTAATAAEFVNPAAAQAVLDAHVAMRDKTSAEYAEEFQNPETTPARKQEIRDIQNGLLPPEQVPMTEAL